MSKLFDRREMLKMMTMMSASGLPVFFQPPTQFRSTQGKKNVLIVVFDAFSAENAPFYGYARDTMPNLASLLDKPIVYHNHYAAGNFTTPGTASLLTGTYPWTHRAVNLGDQVIAELNESNLFSAFDGYYRMAYTHNPYADVFLRQFFSSIQSHTNPESLYLTKHWLSSITRNDLEIARLTAQRIFEEQGQTGNSLLLKTLFREEGYANWIKQRQEQKVASYLPLFPRGLPSAQNPDLSFDTFTLEDAIDWLINSIPEISQPYLTYFHLLPPHESYNTRHEFIDVFLDDGKTPEIKPTHLLANPKGNNLANYRERRQQYDEYILYVDAEFKRLLDRLQESGALENTILVFTSDHGEIFERGYVKHNGPSMHQPIIRVPLVIFDPDINQRVDIYEPTSAVDVLPTLLQQNNLSITPAFEGQVLPPYRSGQRSEPVYAFQAAGSQPDQPFDVFTGMIVDGENKLTYYYGYDGLPTNQPHIELYNLQRDPQELENKYCADDQTAKKLTSQLLSRLEMRN